MRRIPLVLVLAIALGLLTTGCSSSGGTNGELVGIPTKKIRKAEVPYGMVYIPTGSFVMGASDQDITSSQISQNKQITIQAFYMDQTEITNSEYRQFVNWVRDSIAITDYIQGEEFYLKPKSKGDSASTIPKKIIDWRKVGSGRTLWGAKNSSKLQSMYYQGEDRVFDKNELDIRLLKYNFSVL